MEKDMSRLTLGVYTDNLKKWTFLYVMNKYEKFCIEEARFYMDKARHILTEEMKDPKKYYEETFDTHRHLTRVFPYILAMRYILPPQNDSDTEESYQIRSLQSSQTKVVITLNLGRLI